MKLVHVLLVALFGLVALMFWPAFACGCQSKESAKRTVCLSNLKQQATGHLMYLEDSDGLYPYRDRWMDGISPYVRSEDVFHQPDIDHQSYGYAFNSRLSRQLEPKKPETTPLLYDSSNPIRNASDPVTSLPNPGRHAGMNNMAYADGHAKRVPVR